MSVPAADLWSGHQLLMGEPDDSRDLAQWAAYGLVRGDTLLYAADERHPDGKSLAATLGEYGVDAVGAVADGGLVVVAPARFYDLAGYERLVEQGLHDGHGGVRSFGGPVVAAEVLDPAGFAEFECLLDRLWTTRGVIAVCRYPPTGAEALDVAVRRHPSGWGQHLLHVRHGDEGRWGVHGEIDASNGELFASLLGAAAERAAADRTDNIEHGGASEDRESEPLLVLDCTGLDFSAVAAWRAAVAGTEAFRADGGRVVLTGLRPHVLRVLYVTGFAAAFDLSADGGSER